MGKSGILLLAAGKGSYAGWAANMAASLRYWNPDIPIALAVHGQAGQLATEPLYDYIIPIPEEYCKGADGMFAPGKMKLHMDLLTPFEQTLYLDVDGICLKPIGGLFELMQGRTVCSQVVSEHDTKADWWPCKWMPLDAVKRVYPLNEGIIQEINSSFIYFEKSATKFFETARQSYIDDYKTQWGNSFPDELAFNVAGNICGIDMKIWNEPKAELPITFKGEKDAYFVGLFGGPGSGSIRPMNLYEQGIRKPYLSVLGTFTPHKPHILMKQKFIMNGQVKMGMELKEPEPAAIYEVRKAKPAKVKKSPKIGIGITTHNRHVNADKCLSEVKRTAPKGAKIVIVDDASDVPFKDATFRFRHNVGIAGAKNKCLELLDDCDYVFLFDDDTWPKSDNWWEPYIQSGIHHLSFTFDRLVNGALNGNGVFKTEHGLKYHYNPCGCVLFFTRECIEAVGGFNIGFGQYGNEHVDLSVRAYNAGMVPHPFMDVVNSIGLFYSLDYLSRVKSSVKNRTGINKTRPLIGKAGKLPYQTTFEPFTVLTCYFNYANDPQRGNRLKPDVKNVIALCNSVTDKGGKVVLFHDCFEQYPHIEGVEFIKINPDDNYNPYIIRHKVYMDYLSGAKVTGPVFGVDSTDVVCLSSPRNVQENTLYTGNEHGQIVNNDWLKNDEKPYAATIADYKRIIEPHKYDILLNCGIIGGQKETYLEFLQHFWSVAKIHGKHIRTSTDMPLGNYVFFKHFDGRIVSGEPVNTKFKHFERVNGVWFQHK
jgi:glycosyltransferase involved in cell wall biosynthesis